MEKKDLLMLVEEINNKMGKETLSDKDLLLLTAFEISRTFTYDEKKKNR